MGFTAVPERANRDPQATDFFAWLPKFSVRIAVGLRRGKYYAVAPDFAIAGMGATEEEARRDLSGLLEMHLRGFYERGLPFDESLERVGMLTKLRLVLPLRHRKRHVLFPVH